MKVSIKFYIEEKELIAYCDESYDPGTYEEEPESFFRVDAIDYAGMDYTDIVRRWASITGTDLEDLVLYWRE